MKLTKQALEAGKFALYCDAEELSGLKKVGSWVAEDFGKVFGTTPKVVQTSCANFANAIKQTANADAQALVYGNLETSELIRELAAKAGLPVEEIRGKREVYGITEMKDAETGAQLLIVAGSDKRGTIYGLFHLSEELGVSPMVNWGDVLPAKKDEAELSYEKPLISKEPSVRFRGFFINDEWPACGNWAAKHFGGFNARMYERVFEVLLRMKGNYLWPAMWSARFPVDGPGLANAELADELGVVMGMSHHEPCLRQGEEYRYLRGPQSPYGDAWDFRANPEGITKFWEDGLKRGGHLENVITVGMRGEADSKILGENATLKDNIDLLRDVLKVQNELIAKYVNSDLHKVPRMLALYKEVEPFFYGDETTEGLQGSPLLDGVTLMLCDDNFGHLRTVPSEAMRNHDGGYGMYYHFDYHGLPISYEWVNSSNLRKTWDQMTNAYEFGIRELWIVNVGDIFSTEFPLSYFLDLAYDYDKWGVSNPKSAEEYTKLFVQKQFGGYFNETELAQTVRLLDGYTKIAQNRRPEAMNDDVYAPMAYREREKLYAQCLDLMQSAQSLYARCPADAFFPFYEFVYYPLTANLNLQCMWLDTTYNHYLAEIGASAAMPVAKRVEKRMRLDHMLVEELHALEDGKWYGMGLSEHIGFRHWNEEECRFPVLHTFEPSHKARIVGVVPETGAHTEGSFWTKRTLVLPDFARYDVTESELYLYGTSEQNATFTVETVGEWIQVSPEKGTVIGNQPFTLKVSLDKTKLPELEAFETVHAQITVVTEYGRIQVDVPYSDQPTEYVSYEANAFASRQDTASGAFAEMKDFGKTACGMKAFPVTTVYQPGFDAPSLGYRFHALEDGTYEADIYSAPGNPPFQDNLFAFGLQVDDGEIELVRTVTKDYVIRDDNNEWREGVLSQIHIRHVSFEVEAGEHELKIYAATPGFTLEKVVIYEAGRTPQESYLGPAPTKA